MGEETEKPTTQEPTTSSGETAEMTMKTEPQPSTSKAQDSSEEVDVGRAASLLAQGKRNLMCGDVQLAVTQLQEAAQLLGKKYGETSNECGEAYLCYGGALLDLARMESGVLGNALDGIEEEEEEEKSEDSDDKDDEEKPTEEEKEKLSEEILDAMMETDEEAKQRVEKEKKALGLGQEAESTATGPKASTSTGATEEGDESAENTEDDGNTGAESEELNTEEEGDEEEGGEEQEGEEAKADTSQEEDVSNLQVAWEILELAKIIFKRQTSKEGQLKYAETLLKLGEVGLETESYDQALGDLRECLRIQKDILDPEDRRLAETHYQIGLVAHNCYRYEEAQESLKESVSVLQARMDQQRKIIENAEKKEDELFNPEDPVYKAKKEVSDLGGIISDIKSKLEDVLEEKRNAKITKEMVKDCIQSATGSSGFGESSTGFGESSTGFPTATTSDGASTSTADDITHLVRKKRKPEGEEPSPRKDEETKKPRLSTDAAPTSADTAPAPVNGHQVNGTESGSPSKVEKKAEEESAMDVSSPTKQLPEKEVGAGDADTVKA